jgi:hypothetical protein
MTGRAAGYCAGFGVPGYLNNAMGRGFGRGFGFWGRGGRGGGFGFRNRFFATGVPGWARYGIGTAAPYFSADPETEKQALSHQAEMLQTELDTVKKRLEELNSKAQKK